MEEDINNSLHVPALCSPVSLPFSLIPFSSKNGLLFPQRLSKRVCETERVTEYHRARTHTHTHFGWLIMWYALDGWRSEDRWCQLPLLILSLFSVNDPQVLPPTAAAWLQFYCWLVLETDSFTFRWFLRQVPIHWWLLFIWFNNEFNCCNFLSDLNENRLLNAQIGHLATCSPCSPSFRVSVGVSWLMLQNKCTNPF